MRDVSVGNEQEYAVSVAIAKFYLSYASADGLMYPSKRSSNDFNIVIKPDAANAKLFIRKVYGFETKKTSSKEILFRYWKNSTEVKTDGTIIWGTGSELSPLD